jgi:hypothetical protein
MFLQGLNGLQQPLVIDELNGPVLIDGRNRREACRRAGIVPDYVLLDEGADPVSYILSANINRQHMTKGQRAMAVAKIYPDPEKGGRGKNLVFNTEFSSAQLSHARTVLHHAPDLADQVLDGTRGLNKAYEDALLRKGRAET